jgi:hypothetical protein
MKKSAAVLEAIEWLGLSDLEISLEQTDPLDGLSIERNGNKVSIRFSQKAYLFRALGLLKERLEEEQFSYTETARFSMNGIMLDCSRNGVANLQTVKKMLRQLSLMGMNTLMLYTESTYEVEGQPYFGHLWGRYTIAELKELDDYAFERGIEIIPCIQTLGHLKCITKCGGVFGAITDMPGILLAEEEKTYGFIEETVRAVRKAFRSRRIHIGMDETHLLGRGKYYDQHGSFDQPAIFMRHLDRVRAICAAYAFRPMMWGDMPIRLAGCKGYVDDPMDLSKMGPMQPIPADVDLVDWDYYNRSEERYGAFIQKHQEISNHVIFAGGARRWGNNAPNLGHSLRGSRMALESCRKNGVKEVFVTLWGDDGNEQSFFSCWPTVQLFAEYGFQDRVEDALLSRRFNTCTGWCFEDFYALDALNRPDGFNENQREENPPKYLLYQDAMLGSFDYHVGKGYNAYYASCAEKIRGCIERAGDLAYVFEGFAALSEILADKAELGLQITAAYKAGDKMALQGIAEEVLPRLIENVWRYRDLLEKQWNIECKVFGFEVLDIRLGGLARRLQTAKERIEGYLAGRLPALPELEEPRLPNNGNKNKTVFASKWAEIVTATTL